MIPVDSNQFQYYSNLKLVQEIIDPHNREASSPNTPPKEKTST